MQIGSHGKILLISFNHNIFKKEKKLINNYLVEIVLFQEIILVLVLLISKFVVNLTPTELVFFLFFQVFSLFIFHFKILLNCLVFKLFYFFQLFLFSERKMITASY